MNELRESERDYARASGRNRDRSFQFSSPSRGFASADAGTLLRFERRSDVAEEAMRALWFHQRQTRTRVTVAGALAFEQTAMPRLRVHAESSQGFRRPLHLARDVDSSFAPPSKVSMRPTPDGYMRAVRHAVQRIRAGTMSKVVLARSLELSLDRPLDVSSLLGRLSAQNPGKYVFSCELADHEEERRVMIGASPELLVAKNGVDVASHPLAGSLPRSADAAEDRARAERLAQSSKNLREHALVVEAVGDTLAPYCRELHVPREPSLVPTATMWHLGTKVTGALRDPSVSSLSLALALHPTPAVCGEPRAQAASSIAELEGFDRGYYAGSVGYCDAAGDGEWAVTIRCAELRERALCLYAGAGIVADSTPEDELAETTAKLRTMLRALGLERLVEGV